MSLKNLTKNVALKFCVCIFFLESMAEDIGGVEAVLQEHLSFRRKKSTTIRARGDTYTLNPNIQGSFTEPSIHWRGFIRPQQRARGCAWEEAGG
jgi:hypothetical protein